MLYFASFALCAVAAMAAPSPSDNGKWNPARYEASAGKWHPTRSDSGDGKWHPYKFGDTGKYIPTDEGKYIHIPNPYIHLNNPYIHDDEPYVPEETQVDIYRHVLTPPDELLPYYKEGYYRNNGIKIIRQKHNYQEDKYDFDFETENKIRAEEKAVLKNPNTIDEGIASKGFYEYIGPDGFMYRVEYTADENGFRPKVKRLETKYSGKWVLEKVN